MKSIIAEFENRVHEHPHKLLYAFLDIHGNTKTSYTYLEFRERTKNLAAEIHSNATVESGDRVLLVYPPGLEMICAFFSCVRLGLIPVPVYPPSAHGFQPSLQKLKHIAHDCGARTILTEQSLYWSIKTNMTRQQVNGKSPYDESLLNINWMCTDQLQGGDRTNYPATQSEILFLQYTSGSTGEPKGVMVTHENIIHNCEAVVDHIPVGVTWLPQYHDMGLIGYYLFFALKGGTTYGFSPIDFIQRPALWLEAISKYHATASSAPNFAFEYCIEKISEATTEKFDLSSLRFLMTAAEPVNTKVYSMFLQKFQKCGLKAESFFAAYGLAEFTLAVSNYGRSSLTLNGELLKQNICEPAAATASTAAIMSCGRLLNGNYIKIVDVTGEEFKEAGQNEIGEIWLSGKSKCRGYWNKIELSSEIFEATLDTGDATTWLRTGDLGFMNNDELYVCGRLKDTIIIRGANFYPQDIEKIVEEDKDVRKGCVAAFSVTKNGAETLVIIAGLKNNKCIPDAGAINSRILKSAGISATSIVFVPARTIAKTGSGKIMRHQNKKKFETNQLQVISSIDLSSEKQEDDKTKCIGSSRHSAAVSLFKRYGLNGSEHQSLGDAGLDSIKVAEFTQDLKDFLGAFSFTDLSHEVDIRLIQKIAVAELFEILHDVENSSAYSRFKFRQAFLQLENEYRKTEQEIMRRDAEIKVVAQENANRLKLVAPEKHILLTGGTGFFGPFLIKSLLEQNAEKIYVLVRCSTSEEGKERIRKAFDTIVVPEKLAKEFDKRVIPVNGDISRPKLGLKNEVWDFLADNIHTIYHNGAYVNYLFGYDAMRAANVSGTTEIVKLALSSFPKTLNHISTTFIFGWSVKDTLYEADFNSNMEHLDFGYSQSKWVSEQIVRNAMQDGLKARIFRPALISPSVSGEGFNFDISIRLLAFMVEHGIGTSAKNQVSFTPADIAANNIVAIANIKESTGKTFHVTRDVYSTMMDVTKILSALAEKSFTHFPLKNFVPEVVGRCTKKDLLFPLLNFLVRSEQKISSMEFKRYDNSNYVKFRGLSHWGQEDKPLEEVVHGIYLFMQKHGIIKQHQLIKNVR